MANNPEALSSLEGVRWANSTSLQEKKPYSLLIFNLSDPAQANYAIRNSVRFGHLLKRTEKSWHRSIQCFRCLSFGHMAGKCTNSVVCSHCSDDHAFSDCPSKNLKTQCKNCFDHFLSIERARDPAFEPTDFPLEIVKKLNHSALSNSCFLRNQNLTPAPEQEYFVVSQPVEK